MKSVTTKHFRWVYATLCAFGLFACGPDGMSVAWSQEPASNTTFVLPPPSGYVEATKAAPELRQLGEAFTPVTARLLGMFVSEADAKRSAHGEEVWLKRYFLVQLPKSMENRTLTQDELTHGLERVKSNA